MRSALKPVINPEEGKQSWRVGLREVDERNARVSEARLQISRWPKPSNKRSIEARRAAIHNSLDRSSGTPSQDLIAALAAAKCLHAIPKAYPNMTDLSFISPRVLWQKPRPRTLSRRKGEGGVLRSTKVASSQTKLSLQVLLANYIRTIDPLMQHEESVGGAYELTTSLDEAISNLYTDDVTTFLESKGYGVEDLMSWAWIITAASPERAALRLTVLSHRNSLPERPVREVPTFVFLFLLRRPRLTARALKLLLLHGWNKLTGRRVRGGVESSLLELNEAVKPDLWSIRRWKEKDSIVDPKARMDETTTMIMIVRLLRHARVLWPPAIVSIAGMISAHIDGSGSRPREFSIAVLSERTAARLTFLYNRALSLISVPSSLDPFHSLAYHQRAQFNLLKRMTEFEPALAVNREGYRAITRVQVAHRKTVIERQWALMKSKSWPPWKEEKLGLDVEKGIEDGISRASESLSRSKEAGYPDLMWERAAHIAAGWDTDRSPTIQTRTLLRRPPRIRRLRSVSAKGQDSGSLEEKNTYVWASRIRATRTVEEAWACFLATQDEHMPPSQDVYFAMFEKLVFKNRLERRQPSTEKQGYRIPGSPEDTHLPGDGKEVYLAPVFPQEATYTRSQPPSLGDLFDRMIEDGIQPAGRCLAFLVGHARSPGDGFKYLRSSSLSTRAVTALTIPDVGVARYYVADLKSLPDYIFAAVIRLLSRFASSVAPTVSQKRADTNCSDAIIRRSRRRIKNDHQVRISPLLHAFRLMILRRPEYRPPWNSLLSALARPGVMIASSHQDVTPASADVTAWKIMVDVTREMHAASLDLDSQGFQIMCIGLEKAIIASQQKLRKNSSPEILPVAEPGESNLGSEASPRFQLRKDAEEVLNEGPVFIKAAFWRLVGLDSLRGASESRLSGPARPMLGHADQIEPLTLLPRTLSVVGPSHLHAYIRVLGLVRDYDTLLALLRWMANFAPELHAVTDEARNGRRLLRRSLVALRVFLERSWVFMERDDDEEEEDDDSEESLDGAPEHVMQQVYEILEGVEGWGGWPTDEEVAAYCRKGRFS